jgi:hypothetical protein
LLAARAARVLSDRAPRRHFLARCGEAFAKGELAGVDLDSPLRLGAEELLLEPAQLLLGLFESGMRSEHLLDQLFPIRPCKIITPHGFFLTHLTSKAKGNSVDQETKCLFRKLLRFGLTRERKPSPLETFRVEREARPVPYQCFDVIAFAIHENKEAPRVRVLLYEDLLHQRQ